MTRADLMPFCTDPAECRPALEAPFSRGSYTLASNGRLEVRVPRLPDVPEGTCSTQADVVEDSIPGPTWYPCPALPERRPDVPCTRCKGVPTPQCAACHGEGEVEYEFWHDATCYTAMLICPKCDGKTYCGRCDGTGLEPRADGDAEEQPLRVGAALLKTKYLRLLSALPGLEFAPVDGYTPVRFRFQGGDGAIMPMRR